MHSQQGEYHGLYCPSLEKDACGIGLIANLDGIHTHEMVGNALTMLSNLAHRGATGYEENTGDGAGILLQIPHVLIRNAFEIQGKPIPDDISYGLGMLFLPRNPVYAKRCRKIIAEKANAMAFDVLGYREVPVDNSGLGQSAISTEPKCEQVVVIPQQPPQSLRALDRQLFVLRTWITREVYSTYPALADIFHIPSFSCRTLVYKGQLTARQLSSYYPDLRNSQCQSSIALVHSRFSTNTVPKWKLAQPFRCIAHNGEINTIQGNLNWWKAREQTIESKYFSRDELAHILPLCNEGLSDSGNFDRVLEFLSYNGRSLPHVLMMMIPEAWQNDSHFDPQKKAFYQYHDFLMEPWDGPASMYFTDGSVLGATLDRNGLRPSRYQVTTDNVLILASETGCLPVPPEKILKKGRLEPGKILIADLDERRIIDDDELKSIISSNAPYRELIQRISYDVDSLALPQVPQAHNAPDLHTRQLAVGFSREDRDMIVRAMTEDAKEPIGSMGADIPLAVMSHQAQHIGNYFKQQFAQVTNPSIDPLRERAFMTLCCHLGKSLGILHQKHATQCILRLDSPVLDTHTFQRIRRSAKLAKERKAFTMSFPGDAEAGILEEKITELCRRAIEAVSEGCVYLILSHEDLCKEHIAIPSLMICGAVHHALIEAGLRTQASLVIEAGDIWETHHLALLISYGADAVYPALAIDTAASACDRVDAEKQYLYALEKGLYKILSKLGVSTISSYKGAQTFEALGIAEEVVDVCFKGTVSRIGGMTFDMLEQECRHKHAIAFDRRPDLLPNPGIYQWRRDGEDHLFNPTSIHLLQHSTRTGDYNIYKKYTEAINTQERKFLTLRSILAFKSRTPVPLEEVESIEQILKRFATGAMSFGSLSHEAHSTLAIAMNRIGGKSNSGEGGEDPIRYVPDANGDSMRSAIKQIASGRFGVTIEYLNQADELQIKIAQGAKPGEGGQLPGHKVDEWIARVRHSTPGMGLISPPPHHDIYSIEDLAQLIFDLKNANHQARISVKLVSKAGVGIIASGVAKGHAEHILISGSDGGTGASPLSSIRHAGLPWELGLAETHQTLLRNKLRDRVTLQCDGQIRTGRDLAIATLLGAEEWGIATAALVVEGCILMRKCHLNTCPVGVATQDPELRRNFSGKAGHLVNYFHFLAQDLREIMAGLGFHTVDEMVGRTDCLEVVPNSGHWKLSHIDLSGMLHCVQSDPNVANICTRAQNFKLEEVLDRKILAASNLKRDHMPAVVLEFPVQNTDRTVGAMLSSYIVRLRGSRGYPEDTITVRLAGSAGQSFGAFLIKGVLLTLDGDTNDYFGKGLSGGKLVVRPDAKSTFEASENVIIGNVALYGATSGQAYISGRAGERFAVRNSGATAVIEGVGAHGCEYMTGGVVVVIGTIGKNFGAGMSGGLAFVYDPEGTLQHNVNTAMVDLDVPDAEDEEQLQTLLKTHLVHTGSNVASDILRGWEHRKMHFFKVFPKQLKAVLQREADRQSRKFQEQKQSA